MMAPSTVLGDYHLGHVMSRALGTSGIFIPAYSTYLICVIITQLLCHLQIATFRSS